MTHPHGQGVAWHKGGLGGYPFVESSVATRTKLSLCNTGTGKGCSAGEGR